jgi:hypothetical protein
MTITSALIKAAAFERDTRAQHYPAMVARGELTRAQAEADLKAWTSIARWVATGEACLDPKSQPWDGRPTWRPLADAAATAIQRREQACREKPGDARLAQRRQNVAEIHAILSRVADAFEPIT